MTEAKHTPTLEDHPLPWSLDAEEACILDATGDAVQHFEEADERECEYHALIVSAVNAYPLLNEAAEVLRELAQHCYTLEKLGAEPVGEAGWCLSDPLTDARALLSKLEGTMTAPTEDGSETAA